jgi:transcriptional regulator of acetoin/glycerol metabolism
MVQRLVLLESNSGSPVRVAGDVMDLFRHHSWPGNVRQLRNVIRTALALLDGTGDVIRRQHLPEDFLQEIEMWDETRADARVAPVACAPTAPVSLEALELAAIRKALQTHAGNVSAAARELGISRNTLYRKLRGSPGS